MPGPAAVLGACGLYAWEALRAPFMGNADWLSNLLPIIHYRSSILIEQEWPLYTALWYGGRFQWQNPLWSFLYLPSTAVWLALPLDWAARIVTLGHLSAAGLIGYRLAGHWLHRRSERVLGALLFLSPIWPTLNIGHLEKLLAWPWVLLSFYSLLHPRWGDARRGAVAGLCLGVMALTGANYYVLYAGLCLLLIAAARSRRAVGWLIGCSLMGLLHLPSVAFLIGQERGGLAQYVPMYSLNVQQIFQALALGVVTPEYLTWESFSPIGLTTLLALVVFGVRPLFMRQTEAGLRRMVWALWAAAVVLIAAATGAFNQVVSGFNTFRVPARSLAFVAVCLLVIALMGLSAERLREPRGARLRLILLVLAVLQVSVAWWRVRPPGSTRWLDDSGALTLAQNLRDWGAHAVWTTSDATTADMLIDVALTLEQISLPNAYYGEMNQTITARGPYCGYSFDFLLRKASILMEETIALYTSTWPPRLAGTVHTRDLRLVQTAQVADSKWWVYQVICLP